MLMIYFHMFLHTSIPNVQHLLSDFGWLSGYKLNLGKSELFPISLAAKSLRLHVF